MPAAASEMSPIRDLIDEIHEDRIQNLEEGLGGVKTEVAVLGTRMGTMEASITSGFNAVHETLKPISAKLLAVEDEKKAEEARAALIKKYKTPVIALAGTAIGAAIEAFFMWIFGA